MAIANLGKIAAAGAAKSAADKVEKKAMGTTKDSGAIPENEKRIRGLATAKEASRNKLIKSSLAGSGAAIAQASRVGRNRLRRSR